jgi:CubicO group peptidase (beta-lactamase class C family)
MTLQQNDREARWSRSFRLHVIATVATATTTVSAAAPPVAAQGPRPAPAEIARAVDSLAMRVVSSGVTPALGVAVVMDGKTILAKGYGWADATARIPADERTLWYLASTSKSFTGFAISLLAHQRVLDVVAPIASLLPGVRWPATVDPSRLTLEHFLSHTHHVSDNAVVQSAAFTGAIPESDWPRLIQFSSRARNDDLVYSNFGYNVAAMVIDRLRPEGWRRYLDSAVYRPAGMRETYARVSGLDARRIAKPHALSATGFTTLEFEKTDATMNSAGGHVATLSDLARWTIVQMDGGMIDGRQVFPRESVERSHRLIARHTVEASKRFGPFDREGWAAGWDIGAYASEPMVSRFGGYSSIRSHLSMLPRRRIGVVAQVNGPGASGVTDIVAALAYDLEAGRPNARATAAQRVDELAARFPAARERQAASDSVRRARQRPLRRPLTDFAGAYVSDAMGTIAFAVSDGRLAYRWGVLDGPSEVFDAEKDQLRIEVAGSGTIVGFRFDGPGAAKSIDINGVTFVRR